jgi:signal transduction histidine kinase
MKQYVSDTQQWLEKAAGYIQSLKRHSRSLKRGVEGDFALLQVLEDTERLLSHELRLSECRIVIENISPELTLHGDAGKLGQVFTNLITNAIDAYKETDAGRGEIGITVHDDGDSLYVFVQDHASGIPPEHCEHIFEEFFSTKLQGKGTGLGLGICQNIMSNFFSGTLAVESQLGQGSTFILKIAHQQQKFPDKQKSYIAPEQETSLQEISLNDTLLAA